MSLRVDAEPVSSPLRDGVGAVADDGDPPPIVSISDVHGYLEDARDALLTLEDHPDYDPVVTAAADGTLHWAGEDYVLLFNGDLIDRGPDNEAMLSIVGRLVAEAPTGRVRVNMGNHEWMILFPDKAHYRYYSTTLSDEDRRVFLERILEGHVGAAYEGHSLTYSHAGSSDPLDVTAINDRLQAAAWELLEALGTDREHSVQTSTIHDDPALFGTGAPDVTGPSAGLFWRRFGTLPDDAPPQVVGHTPHPTPRSEGDVHCQDLLVDNRGSAGGQGIFFETPDVLRAVRRTSDDDVVVEELG